MSEELKLTIDGKNIQMPKGSLILDAAEEAGIHIPTLCYSRHTKAMGLCRVCVVEVEDRRGLQPACVTPVRAGMVVHTRTPRIERVRRTILEMLASSVDLSDAPEIESLLEEYGARPTRFQYAQARTRAIIEDNPVFIRDYSKCILCWRCVQVCAEDAQFSYAISRSGRGFRSGIATFLEKPLTETTCVFCGQCVGTCPTGALKSKREMLLEEGVPLADLMETTRARGLGRASRKGPRLDTGG